MSATFLTDLKNVVVGGVSILPQTYSTAGTKTGSAVDLLTADGPVSLLAVTGDCGDANTNFYFRLTECDTSGGTYTTMADSTSDTYTGATAGDNLMVVVSSAKRTKRYVKAECVIATTGTASVPVSVAVLARKKIVGTGDGSITS